jgi:hypothetical protein
VVRRFPGIARWAIAGFVLVAPVQPARAYERATVEGAPHTKLSWPVRTLRLRIADDTSADVAAPDLRAAIRRSLATWTRADGCTDIELLDDGSPLGLRTNLMGGLHDGENRIVFREEAWPPALGPETLAITTIVYRRSTGEILDADIDVNAVDHAWSATDVPRPGANDVENTITHELGHFLGFAHVADPEATMYGRSDPGDIAKRDLSPDDVRAVCEVYPRGSRTPGGEGPRSSLHSDCAAAPPRGGASSAAGALFAGLTLALWRRLRRR